MKAYRNRSRFRRGLAVSFLCLLTIARAAVFSPDENTLHVWNFALEDTNGLTDKKAGLELKPSARVIQLQWVEGRHGKALVFPGDLKLQSTRAVSPAPLDRAVTVECWLRIEDKPGRIVGVLEHMDYAQKTGYRLALGADGKLRWVVLDSAAEQVNLSKTPIVPGAWTHVAVTYDGATMATYINGVRDSWKSLAGGVLDASDRPLVVGFYTDVTAKGFFKGEIEGLRISNAAKKEFKLD